MSALKATKFLSVVLLSSSMLSSNLTVHAQETSTDNTSSQIQNSTDVTDPNSNITSSMSTQDTKSSSLPAESKTSDAGESKLSAVKSYDTVRYKGKTVQLEKQPKGAPYHTPTNLNDYTQGTMGSTLKPNALVKDGLSGIPVTDKTRPRADVIDVSSYQGSLSVEDFQHMKNNGVQAILVKLTEGTSYVNPFAKSQVENAKAAGLNVGAYHFSWFTDQASAEAEADFFAGKAREYGLSQNTVMINDVENQVVNNGYATQNSIYFALRLINGGFKTVVHYSSVSWFDSGILNANLLDKDSIWVAQYPNNPLASSLLNTDYGAWQWASDLTFPKISGKQFDVSIDYAGYLSNSGNVPNTQGKPVTVRYVNQSENISIQSDTVLNGKLGENYVISPPTIQGYSYRSSDSNLIGRFTETEQTVTLYYQKESQPKGTTTVSVSSNQNTVTATFTPSEGESNISQIYFPTWSQQDSSKKNWYSATKQQNGTWIAQIPISDFGKSGNYSIHTYAKNREGNMIGLAINSFEVEQPSIDYQITNKNNMTGDFDVVVKNVKANNLKTVLIPVWADKNQADCIWYRAIKQVDGSFKASIKASNHGNRIGHYNIHLYTTTESGISANRVTNGTDVTIDKRNDASASLSKLGDSVELTATLRDISVTPSFVTMAVWGEKNGQNDIKWVMLEPQGNGVYKATDSIVNHKETGVYSAHLYYFYQGVPYIIKTMKFTVGEPDFTVENTILDKNSGKWKTRITVKQAPFGISEIRVPTWSKENQRDITWSKAKSINDTTYEIEDSIQNHENNRGHYKVHVYLYDKNNGNTGRVSPGIDL